MTEFKKLVSLVDKLGQDVEMLYTGRDAILTGIHSNNEEVREPQQDQSPWQSVDALFNVSREVKTAIMSATPRMQKIVAKARETDPNRQIYNEAMCGKIEVLLRSYIAVVIRLLYETNEETAGRDKSNRGNEEGEEEEETREDAIEKAILEGVNLPLEDSAVLVDIESRHDVSLLQRAAAEAWAERVAGDLAQAVAFEKENRLVLEAEEKQERAHLAEWKRKSKKEALRVLQLLEEKKWSAEALRRSKESLWLMEASQAVSVEAVSAFISTHIADTRVRKAFINRTKSLCMALLTTPEDINIRRLRCNNQHLIEDYGHCCVAACPCAAGGHDDISCCRAVSDVAEVMWYLLGYRVLYTGTRTWGVPALLRSGTLVDSSMPCGGLMSDHKFSLVGFEDYSERLFELREPDPADQPDLWMLWFDRVGLLSCYLENAA